MAPSDDEIRVALGELRLHAAGWQHEEQQLQYIRGITDGLDVSGVEWGDLFAGLREPYLKVKTFVGNRATEGAAETDRVESTLYSIARVYQAEENMHVHALKNLY